MKTLSKAFQMDKKYFMFSILLTFVETLIARYARDQIIRPYGGDFLVVILLYCIIRCFTRLSVNSTCIVVLSFSYFVELLQYFNLADKLGFQPGSLSYILLGNYFTWVDIISYTLGIGAVVLLEKFSIIDKIRKVKFEKLKG
jgi:hypothetical protein